VHFDVGLPTDDCRAQGWKLVVELEFVDVETVA